MHRNTPSLAGSPKARNGCVLEGGKGKSEIDVNDVSWSRLWQSCECFFCRRVAPAFGRLQIALPLYSKRIETRCFIVPLFQAGLLNPVCKRSEGGGHFSLQLPCAPWFAKQGNGLHKSPCVPLDGPCVCHPAEVPPNSLAFVRACKRLRTF